ncbi:hypothetical protein ATN88_22015 [Enterovibrio coralii]|uniref:DUF7661 domain-containing protein n=1 Tax=Enterovibrio coralii TaxID=294935 RepID=A0A135I4Y4_9GAMM|nr:hypothetical protein ATN88_22015 [Enterovibrio coralii]
MEVVFNVFGQLMSVRRIGDEWQLFKESPTAMRVRVYDVVIPNEMTENELLTYLGDIYHEHANAAHPHVLRVS